MKVSAAARGRARRIAMQALYQWHMTDNPLHIIEAECHVENEMEKVDTEYFSELFHGVAKQKTDIDAQFKPYVVGLAFDKLDPISLAVLRPRLIVSSLALVMTAPYLSRRFLVRACMRQPIFIRSSSLAVIPPLVILVSRFKFTALCLKNRCCYAVVPTSGIKFLLQVALAMPPQD